MNNHKKLINNYFSGKKGQGLPINMVVMLIIGIIIFGLGFALFAKISNAGEDEIEKWNYVIITGIASLECDGDEWICSPSNKIKTGNSETFRVFVANKGEEQKNFQVEFADDDNDGLFTLSKDCGSITIGYPSSTSTNVMSGESAEIPFRVKAENVEKTPCSFVTTATLKIPGVLEDKKTPIVIRVE